MYHRAIVSVFDKTAPLRLLFGDIVCFLAGLYGMLFFRYLNLSVHTSRFPFVNIPTKQQYLDHLFPFILVFLASVIVFYIAGLYDYHTSIFKRRIGTAIISGQLWSALVAIALFYFVPFFGIAPKISLFLYVIISSILIIFWRLVVERLFVRQHDYPVMLFGSGKALSELQAELSNHQAAQFNVVDSSDMNVSSEEELRNKIQSVNSNILFIVIDFSHPKTEHLLPFLYSSMFKGVVIVDFTDLYEDIFQKVNLSSVSYEWLLEHVSRPRRPFYSFIKRSLDIAASSIGLILSLIFLPLVWIAIKLDDAGPTFIFQERLGLHKKIIRIAKYRSMTTDDRGVWVKEKDNRITRIGKILRTSRIDELPQLWSVFKGDLSLIGPRPDLVDLGKTLAEQIPYYDTRYVVEPGLSGWAQITQELPPQSLEETRERLAYDMYYVKHRSLFLDLSIMLKTVRTLLSRTGK